MKDLEDILSNKQKNGKRLQKVQDFHSPKSTNLTKKQETAQELTLRSPNPLLAVFQYEGRSDEEISEHVDNIIDAFSVIYGFKFLGKNPEPEDYFQLRRGWSWAVRPFSAKTIMRAVNMWHSPGPYDRWDSSWPPSPHDFYTLCKSLDHDWSNKAHKKEIEGPKSIKSLCVGLPNNKS